MYNVSKKIIYTPFLSLGYWSNRFSASCCRN